MRTTCDYCGKKVSRSRKQVEKYEHHFCNKKCYFAYRRKVGWHIRMKGAKQDHTTQEKLEKMAEMRKQHLKKLGNVKKMKKTRMGVLTLLMILIGSCATLAVATPITTLGDIDYYNTQNNFMVNDTIPGNVNLTFVYSEMNESALIYEKIWYNDNVTTYKFTTSKTYVEWWFTPGTKYFVYQDMATNKLYSVGVNYTDIDIPENPYEKRHRQLVENYTLIMNNYNLTDSALTNITMQFNELNDTYNQKMQLFDMTWRKNQNLSENLTDLRTDFNDLDDKYNKTEALWKVAIDNVSYYQTKYDGLIGIHGKLEKDHNDLSGAIPWYIMITIIGTFLFTFIYIRRKTIFEPKQEVTDEIATGYGRIHSAIDKHILSRFRKEPKTGEEDIKDIKEWPAETPMTPENTPEETGKKATEKKPIQSGSANQMTHEEILTIVHEKIDANNREMNSKIDMSINEMNEKIDNIIKGK